MQKVVGVRFKPAGKIYYFDPTNIYLKLEDNVIVETARGLEYGTVASKVKYVEEDEVTKPIKPVIRKPTAKDTKTNEENLRKAEKALKICKEEIIKQKLDMKLIRAEYTFNASKVIFYFTADSNRFQSRWQRNRDYPLILQKFREYAEGFYVVFNMNITVMKMLFQDFLRFLIKSRLLTE